MNMNEGLWKCCDELFIKSFDAVDKTFFTSQNWRGLDTQYKDVEKATIHRHKIFAIIPTELFPLSRHLHFNLFPTF